jgi:predicted transcriptional regulator
MKPIPRRDRLKIYADLLYAIHSEPRAEKIVLTRIQVKIKVPYDRLKSYIVELSDLGLVEDDTSLILTKKGIQYLREYEKVLDFMKRMGLAYR